MFLSSLTNPIKTVFPFFCALVKSFPGNLLNSSLSLISLSVIVEYSVMYNLKAKHSNVSSQLRTIRHKFILKA